MNDQRNFCITCCALLLLLASSGKVRAGQVEDPQVVAKNVYSQIQGHLNIELSNALVNQYFDTQSMALHALGLPYRSFSNDQKAAYVQAFDAYFKKALYHFLTANKDATVSNLSSRVEGDRAIARCVLTPASGQAIELTFPLFLGHDSWKADDVMVDNVSLILGYRPQFRRLYMYGSFDGLVGYLNSH